MPLPHPVPDVIEPLAIVLREQRYHVGMVVNHLRRQRDRHLGCRAKMNLNFIVHFDASFDESWDRETKFMDDILLRGTLNDQSRNILAGYDPYARVRIPFCLSVECSTSHTFPL
jgi:hypothetical protein